MEIARLSCDADALEAYARIGAAFTATHVLDVTGSRGAFELRERRLPRPFVKDYDALPGSHPTEWPRRFELSSWGLFAAREGDHLVGAVAVAPPGAGAGERADRAALWDLRVAPGARRRGVGSALFAAAARWCLERGWRDLEIETQDVNVPACRFYARQGCLLVAASPHAYPELPEETRLLWHKRLTP